MAQEERHKPPYVAWSTLRTFVWHLKELPAPPTHITRSVWSKWIPGGVGPQLMTALRYLYLIDDEGALTDEFSTILHATDDAKAKVLLRDRIKAAYEPIFGGLDLARATYEQIDDRFEHYGVGGDVKRKAIAFFLGAARELNIPLSTLVLERARPARRGPRRIKKERVPTRAANGTANDYVPPPPGGAPQEDPLTLLANYMPMIFDPTRMPDEVQQAWVKLFTWVKAQTVEQTVER